MGLKEARKSIVDTMAGNVLFKSKIINKNSAHGTPKRSSSAKQSIELSFTAEQ